MNTYVEPTFRKSAFNCPLCNAYAKQSWSPIQFYLSNRWIGTSDLIIAMCSHCQKYSIWFNEKLIYPLQSTAPLSNPDLPDDIKADYEEARNIVTQSPRGAAALLRLSIQKLCKYLGEGGKDLNKDIGNLVKKGLPIAVKEALDTVRLIGNEAVHPGQLDLKDDIKTANALFDLVNFIVEKMISEPKKIKELHDKLPETKKEAIEKRDST